MRVYARHQKDVNAALTTMRDYREIAEAQGVIRPTSPQDRLTEARHALHSALLPPAGVHHYPHPARRQRDILRALEELTRAAAEFGQDNIAGHNAAIAMTGPDQGDPRHTSITAIDERVQQNAGQHTKSNAANQPFLEQRLMTHVGQALQSIGEVEQSFKVNGSGATTQALAIRAAGHVMAVAYTQEAKHEGASLSARHDRDEFKQLRPTPPTPETGSATGPTTKPQTSPATGP